MPCDPNIKMSNTVYYTQLYNIYIILSLPVWMERYILASENNDYYCEASLLFRNYRHFYLKTPYAESDLK